MTEQRMVDNDGELILTYQVTVHSRGKQVLHLGTGMSAVFRFCDIVEAGIPEAISIENPWGYNYLVTMNGAGLQAFLRRCYPKYAYLQTDPDEEYVIDCYDMS